MGPLLRVLTSPLVLLPALFFTPLAFGGSVADRPYTDGASSSPGPDHYYVGRKGDAFEYAKLPGGPAEAQNTVLVWYLGTNQDKEPVIRYQDGASSGTLSCFDHCQFVRGATFVGEKLVQTGRIRVTNDPLIYMIMHDASAGRLRVPAKNDSFATGSR
jgi:hypothetical protein